MACRNARWIHRLLRLAAVLTTVAVIPSRSVAEPKAPAPSVRISAQVDRTTLEVGGQLTVTLTIEGEAAHVELKPVEFPKPFQIIAQSRASNISVERGRLTKSISLIYVLMPTEAGTFRLGPFQMTSPDGQPVLTDPLDIVVNKPVLPPQSKPSQRFIL